MNTTIQNEAAFRWSEKELYCGNLHIVTLNEQFPPGEEPFVLLASAQFAPMLDTVANRYWLDGIPFRLRHNDHVRRTVEWLYRMVLSELEFNIHVRVRPIEPGSRQMEKARRHFQWRYDKSDSEFDADEMLRIYCRLWEITEQNGFDSDTGKPRYHVDLQKEDYLPPDIRKRLDEQGFDGLHYFEELLSICVLSPPLSETLSGYDFHEVTEPDELFLP